MRIHGRGALTAPLAILLAGALFLSPLAAQVASADPGPGQLQIIKVTSSTTVTNGAIKTGAGGPSSISTDLGGVTAFSTGALQFREGLFYADFSGLTESQTSSSISELETHGALIHSYSSADCYNGDYLQIVGSMYAYNTTDVTPGWTPFYTVTKTNCILMASGHHYIYNGAQTDVPGPDAAKVY